MLPPKLHNNLPRHPMAVPRVPKRARVESVTDEPRPNIASHFARENSNRDIHSLTKLLQIARAKRLRDIARSHLRQKKLNAATTAHSKVSSAEGKQASSLYPPDQPAFDLIPLSPVPCGNGFSTPTAAATLLLGGDGVTAARQLIWVGKQTKRPIQYQLPTSKSFMIPQVPPAPPRSQATAVLAPRQKITQSLAICEPQPAVRSPDPGLLQRQLIHETVQVRNQWICPFKCGKCFDKKSTDSIHVHELSCRSSSLTVSHNILNDAVLDATGSTRARRDFLHALGEERHKHAKLLRTLSSVNVSIMAEAALRAPALVPPQDALSNE